MYLFYSSTLSWKGAHGGLRDFELERLHRDLKEGDGHTDPLMHRVRRDEPCPPWLEFADAAIGPRAAERWRMDFVLDDVTEAPVVEVLGARFLRASATGAAPAPTASASGELRAPTRLKRRVGYGDASVSASVDTWHRSSRRRKRDRPAVAAAAPPSTPRSRRPRRAAGAGGGLAAAAMPGAEAAAAAAAVAGCSRRSG